MVRFDFDFSRPLEFQVKTVTTGGVTFPDQRTAVLPGAADRIGQGQHDRSGGMPRQIEAQPHPVGGYLSAL